MSIISPCIGSTDKWEPYYSIVKDVPGNASSLVDFGDELNAGDVDATSFTGMRFHANGLAASSTPQPATSAVALSGWDTPFTLRDLDNWLGLAPVLAFNGSNENADTPAAGTGEFWTPSTRSSDSAFSVGAWLNITDTAARRAVIAKWDDSGGSGNEKREWLLAIESDNKAKLHFIDEDASAPSAPDRVTDAAVAQGSWIFLVASYDGGGGSTMANGITFYVDGASVASTASNASNYVAMDVTAADPTRGVYLVGSTPAMTFPFNGKMLGGPWGPFFVQSELTAEQVADYFQRMRMGVGV
jgi:hypothetical protein